jgi:hypothetical protein
MDAMNSTNVTTSFIKDALDRVCKTDVPPHMVNAWSSPFQLIFIALLYVDVVAAVPLFHLLKERLFSWSREKVSPILEVAGDDVEDRIADIEEGLTENINGLPEGVEALAGGGGGGEEEEEEEGEEEEKEEEEPDQAAAVFHIVLHLLSAMNAFFTYWVS